MTLKNKYGEPVRFARVVVNDDIFASMFISGEIMACESGVPQGWKIASIIRNETGAQWFLFFDSKPGSPHPSYFTLEGDTVDVQVNLLRYPIAVDIEDKH